MTTAISLVPQALQPAWMRATWNGAHGSGGVTARIDHASTVLTLTDDGLAGVGSARGGIDAPGEGSAGGLSRGVKLEANGRLTVSHNLLTVPGSAQGSGFARGFNDHAFARYADAGVDAVDIHAALTVGGYAWARQGFELQVPDGVTGRAADLVRAQKISRIVDGALSSGRLSHEQYDAISTRLLQPGGDLPPNALVRIADLAAIPEIGAAALLRSDWYGSRPIDKTQPWWGAAPTSDAAAGAAQLAASASLGTIGIERAAAIDATLPTMFQRASGATFAQAIDGAGAAVRDAAIGARSTATVNVTDHGLQPVGVKHVFPLVGDRELNLSVKIGHAGTPQGGQFVTGGDVREHQAAIDDAWRAIGIRVVNDASYSPPVRRLG